MLQALVIRSREKGGLECGLGIRFGIMKLLAECLRVFLCIEQLVCVCVCVCVCVREREREREREKSFPLGGYLLNSSISQLVDIF